MKKVMIVLILLLPLACNPGSAFDVSELIPSETVSEEEWQKAFTFKHPTTYFFVIDTSSEYAIVQSYHSFEKLSRPELTQEDKEDLQEILTTFDPLNRSSLLTILLTLLYAKEYHIAYVTDDLIILQK